MASRPTFGSVTSYNELRREALAADRWNRLHPTEKTKQPYILSVLEKSDGPYHRRFRLYEGVPDQLAPWLGTRLVNAGNRRIRSQRQPRASPRHFEINAESIATAALSRLARDGKFDPKRRKRPSQTWA